MSERRNKRIYDDKLYFKIKDLIRGKHWQKAKKFLLEYMEMYPSDMHAKVDYINLLRKMGFIDDAYDLVCELMDNDNEYIKIEAFLVFLAHGDYERAYELYDYVEPRFSESPLSKVLKMDKIFLEKQLNIKSNDKANCYTEAQLLKYDRNRALRHVKQHEKVKTNKVSHSVFEPEIDVDELFVQVENAINEATYKVTNHEFDIYAFEYPKVNVTYEKDKRYKYLEVVAIKNTNQIITFYPNYSNSKPDCNLLYQDSYKVKKVSQIDKFNKKWNMSR